MKLSLTPGQEAELEPMFKEACRIGGTIFCQVHRLTFPEHESLVLSCHTLPGDVSRRLKAFLAKEAERMATKEK